MSNEIYTAPQSQLNLEAETGNILASRWSRMFASILDTFVIMIVLVPVMYLTGAFDGIAKGVEPSLGYNLAVGSLGLLVFVIANGKLLISNGQTIGKKILGIKIVDLDGGVPDLSKHLLKRYAVYFIPGQVPIAGQIFSIVNIIFIFGKQKRCVHDYAAGTKVVVS